MACWIFFLLETAADIGFGAMVPGYDWIRDSISHQGQESSPAAGWVCIWGIGFTLLLILFSAGFFKAFSLQKWVNAATALMIIYAVGEGIGTWSFPINPPGAALTKDGFLHNLFSAIGDAALTTLQKTI